MSLKRDELVRIACPHAWLLCGPSRIQQAPFGLRDRSTQLPRGLDPLLNHDLRIRESLCVGLSVGRAARELGRLSDVCFILVAPIDDEPASAAPFRTSTRRESRGVRRAVRGGGSGSRARLASPATSPIPVRGNAGQARRVTDGCPSARAAWARPSERATSARAPDRPLLESARPERPRGGHVAQRRRRSRCRSQEEGAPWREELP